MKLRAVFQQQPAAEAEPGPAGATSSIPRRGAERSGRRLSVRRQPAPGKVAGPAGGASGGASGGAAAVVGLLPPAGEGAAGPGCAGGPGMCGSRRRKGRPWGRARGERVRAEGTCPGYQEDAPDGGKAQPPCAEAAVRSAIARPDGTHVEWEQRCCSAVLPLARLLHPL